MSEIPTDAFQPLSGRLGQTVFATIDDDSAPELRFFIEIAFRPFDWDDATLSPLLRVDNIVVPVRSWTELAKQVFEFPHASKPGSVEAAVLLFGQHNPADVTRLEFGPASDGKLACRFDTEVDFECEADRDDLGQVELSIDLSLEAEPLRVSTALEKRCQGDPATIQEAAAQAVDLSPYGEVEKVAGGFVFPVVPAG